MQKYGGEHHLYGHGNGSARKPEWVRGNRGRKRQTSRKRAGYLPSKNNEGRKRINRILNTRARRQALAEINYALQDLWWRRDVERRYAIAWEQLISWVDGDEDEGVADVWNDSWSEANGGMEWPNHKSRLWLSMWLDGDRHDSELLDDVAYWDEWDVDDWLRDDWNMRDTLKTSLRVEDEQTRELNRDRHYGDSERNRERLKSGERYYSKRKRTVMKPLIVGHDSSLYRALRPIDLKRGILR
jgi:hypothetical protein